VPGYLQDKLVALLRGLPKELRRELCDSRHGRATHDGAGAVRPRQLFERLAELVTAEAGARVEADLLAHVPLPPWLRMNVRVLDEQGQELRRARDLEALRQELRVPASRAARPHAGTAGSVTACGAGTSATCRATCAWRAAA